MQYDRLTSLKTIKVLNKSLWENRVLQPRIDKWLSGFTAGVLSDTTREQDLALYLLSRLLYFGSREIRQMLNTSYHANVKRQLIENIKSNFNVSAYSNMIEQEYNTQLMRVRFLGVGNPSESGTHLLYYYRQENRLPKELFIHADQIFDRSTGKLEFADESVDWYIFLDDFCGSGEQVGRRLSKLSKEIKELDGKKRVSYHMLVATSRGLSEISTVPDIDDHSVVLELDDTFRILDPQSRYLTNFSQQDKTDIQNVCAKYGTLLFASHPLGYRDCQLLLSFHHNTPDNSLPILWAPPSSIDWHPVLDRYPKLEFN
ncbi:hypothetical protein IQ258_19640 [Coleofasciculus sp. LEGE 07081]|uniref:phosphoribosyltransferase-like protein n=1 Tax=Coleofasciculus sp. LEGE 07081 TaxID=2777967 RepID=UPI00187EA3D3|nr:hypothetical protein [Coleofasciculus sp. LEGE 07081]MBE9128316.1 hypothetical protein [Coleofasciculus sp. LEGE 07081]